MDDSRRILRRLAVVCLGSYALWLAFGYQYHFLDGVNLLVHEAGHVLFSPFGETMAVAGGTILQLAFPAAFVVSFWRKGQRFAAAVCGVWAAESLMYTATYLGDARLQELPLIGGHIHDWNYLLGRAGWLERAEGLGIGLHIGASLLALGFAWLAWREAWGETT